MKFLLLSLLGLSSSSAVFGADETHENNNDLNHHRRLPKVHQANVVRNPSSASTTKAVRGPAKKEDHAARGPAKKEDNAARGPAMVSGFNYFDLDFDFLDAVEAAPTVCDKTPDKSGICDDGDFLIEMYFWTDGYSFSENEISLVSDIDSASPEILWDYPVGSFKESANENDADYYMRACICPTKCHEFTFLDTWGDFDWDDSQDWSIGMLELYIDDHLEMFLESTEYSSLIWGHEASSILPNDYHLYIGECAVF